MESAHDPTLTFFLNRTEDAAPRGQLRKGDGVARIDWYRTRLRGRMHQSNSATFSASAFFAVFAVYLEAFAERDPVRRGELLARCLTADGEIWGPNRMFVGYEAISAKIAAFHGNWPECRLVLASGISVFDNVVRLGNAIVGPDNSIRARGETIFALADDGRIQRVVPFWDMKLPGLPQSWPAHLGVPVAHEKLSAS